MAVKALKKKAGKTITLTRLQLKLVKIWVFLPGGKKTRSVYATAL
jgi:hypothetical protein